MKTEPLAIVGIGCLFPKADGPGAYWANCKNGVDAITEVPTDTHWDPADYFDADPKRPDMTYARRGGFLSPVAFNPLEFGIAPRDLEATDTSQLLGLVAAKQALVDAGILPGSGFRVPGPADPARNPVNKDRVSVILGVTGTLELVIPLGARLGHPKWKQAMREAGVPDDAIEDAAKRIADSYVPWQENSFPGLLGNVVAGRIANRLDLGGTNCVVDAACASSLSAVHLAAMELQTGRADVVVTGGVDTFNDIFMYMCFSKTPALSPTGDAKPFAADGDGTILGEGLGVVVLKRLADADRDGDTVYAVLKGIGSSSDGKGNAIYAPSAAGQKKALKAAYERAGVTPDTIELVEGHGTGTKVGDTVEATALAEVYSPFARGAVSSDPIASGQRQPWCAVGSVKSQVGHTKAAAGAASLIKAALALYYKVLPPTLKVSQPVEPFRAAGSPFYVNTEKRPWLPRPGHPRRAALSAFGFGGSNFHAVLEEHRPDKREVDWDGRTEIWAASGPTVDGVSASLASVPTDWKAFARAAEAARKSFDPSADCRLVLVAHRDSTDLPELIASAKAKLAESPTAGWSLPDGAYFGRGVAGGVGVLFPGQGSQQVGMLRDLACLFPELLDTLGAANAPDPAGGPRLSDRIYPPRSFAPDAKAAQDAALRATDVAQPALGAVGYGAWRVLSERFGLNATAFAGHSYGELVALTAAGRLTADELHHLSRLRGRLMADQPAGDAGAMLAVFASLPDVEATIRTHTLGVVVANQNAPTQNVLSGPTPEIERAERAFAGAGVRAVRLPVAGAFHSPLVADAAGPFRAALAETAFPSSARPVFANTTAAPYPADPAACRELLGNQLANPVKFADQIRAMAAAGVRTFVEVGPGTVLTRLAEATLAEAGKTDVSVIPIDASGGKRSGVLDLAHALGRLAARGCPVRLAAWEEGSRCRPAADPPPGLAVPICGANYVSPRPKLPPRPVARPTPPAGVPPMTDPAPDGLAQAVSLTQQTLAALQQLQEQTARLHKQFLESQEQAQRTLFTLVGTQQALLFPGTQPVAVPLPPVPAPAPAPIPLPPPPTVAHTPPPQPVAPPPQDVVRPAAPVPPAPVADRPAEQPAADIERVLLEVVAEKTGYPAGMLDLGMSLDADLGVDSIKRVEILAALQDKLPAAPAVKPEHLGTLHTLADVAAFLAGPPAPTGGLAVPTAVAVDPALVPLDGNGGGSRSDIERVLLEVVAEKTGYPAGMLDLGMSLDADLGVDSIKRVEILAALQDKLPAAPAVKPEHLGTLHTLADVAAFLATDPPPVTDFAPIGSGPHTAKIPVAPVRVPPPTDDLPPAPTTSRVPISRPDPVTPPLSESVAPATEPMSRLKPVDDLAVLLDPPPVRLPVDLPAAPTISAAYPETNRQPVAMIHTDRIDRSILQAVDLDLTATRHKLPLPATGEVWVVGPDEPFTRGLIGHLTAARLSPALLPWADPDAVKPGGFPVGLVLVAPARQPAGPAVSKIGFRWLQYAGGKLRQAVRPGSAALFATVARLDGAFGLADLDPATDPAGGGLAGLVKTAKQEWPEVSGKAIDVAAKFVAADPDGAAAAVADELRLAGPLEVGVSQTHRCGLETARTARRQTATGPALTRSDVVLVTGGGRGVTAEVAVALAQVYQPTLVLTGRTPAPTGPEPDWSAGLSDEASLKKAIAAQLGDGATPKAVGDFYHRLMAQREVARTLRRIEQAGAVGVYAAVNAANARQVADLVQKVTVKHGPVTAVVHGAGVLADKRIEDLTAEQFDAVYSTKVDGLRTVLDLLAHQELKAVMLFSSTTARYGRAGQLAYACANEVLNKMAQVEARRRPACRVVAVNWGPWDGGMVTPALRRVFESEGHGLIPLTEGGLFAVQELTAAGKAVEVIALGKPAKSGRSGVAAPVAAPTPVPTPSAVPPKPAPVELRPAFERTLAVDTHPVLRSHVLDGRAVLPMALHLELLAHAALHAHPGLVFHGLNDLRIIHGVMVEDGGATPLTVVAGKATKDGAGFLVRVELRGKRRDGRDTIHTQAEVVLAASLPKPPTADPAPVVQPYPHPVDEVYKYFLFHGPDLQGIERVDGLSETAFIGTAYPAPPPAEWFSQPLRSGWLADPLVLDASFQMMILWSYAQHGAGSLPCFAGRFRQYRRAFPAGPVKVVIRVTKDNGQFARADIDYLDADGVVVAQVQDYECVIDRQLDAAFRKNQLAPKAKV